MVYIVHSYANSFICELIYMWIYVNSFTRELIHMWTHSYVNSFICELIHMWTHSYVNWFICELIHMWTDPRWKMYMKDSRFTIAGHGVAFESIFRRTFRVAVAPRPSSAHSFICVTWLICICDRTHRCVTWLESIYIQANVACHITHLLLESIFRQTFCVMSHVYGPNRYIFSQTLHVTSYIYESCRIYEWVMSHK